MKIDKKNLRLITSGILVVLFVAACSSREDKVAELIKKEMFSTLYDYDSYQPVETKIDTLRRDKYGDTLIFDNAMLLSVASDAFDKANESFYEQKEIAEIYTPSYYSSSYSNNKFSEARKKMRESLGQMQFFVGKIDSLNNEIKKIEKDCDNKQYGWLVTHKFRCKTKGGNSNLLTSYFFVDDKCKRILRQFDDEKMSLELYKDRIDAALEEEKAEDEK